MTKAYEVKNVVKSTVDLSKTYGTHQADEVIELLGELLYLEIKMWSRSYLREGFRRALSKTVRTKANGEDADKIGQLLPDIAEFAQTGRFPFRWEMGGDLARQGMTEDDLVSIVMDLIRKDETIRNNVAEAAGIVISENPVVWGAFLRRLESNLSSSSFFKIENYSNILSKLSDSSL